MSIICFGPKLMSDRKKMIIIIFGCYVFLHPFLLRGKAFRFTPFERSEMEYALLKIKNESTSFKSLVLRTSNLRDSTV